jgi:UV DNA damage endonuclease
MKIGYPCINRSIGCTTNSTFRLRNYSKENLIEKLESNLNCLGKILEYNLKNNLLFFRISSNLIPFASHPICKFDWIDYFKEDFRKIGNFIKNNNMRISMHPDQFVLINSLKKDVTQRSIRELEYHCNVLDAMKLDDSAKVQIHIGGVYGNKKESIMRFIANYQRLPKMIKNRLAIENDERLYSLKDCLIISEKVDMPVILDTFHHRCHNNRETLREAIVRVQKRWQKKDGIPMVDYSSQKRGARIGSHTEQIDISLFQQFLEEAKGFNFDIMLEIKDKERSALKAIKCLK